MTRLLVLLKYNIILDTEVYSNVNKNAFCLYGSLMIASYDFSKINNNITSALLTHSIRLFMGHFYIT